MSPAKKLDEPNKSGVSTVQLIGTGVGLLIVIIGSWVNMEVKIAQMQQNQENTFDALQDIREIQKEDRTILLNLSNQMGGLKAQIDDVQRQQDQKNEK